MDEETGTIKGETSFHKFPFNVVHNKKTPHQNQVHYNLNHCYHNYYNPKSKLYNKHNKINYGFPIAQTANNETIHITLNQGTLHSKPLHYNYYTPRSKL